MASVRATTHRKYHQTMLLDVYFIFNRSRHVHVVSQLLDTNASLQRQSVHFVQRFRKQNYTSEIISHRVNVQFCHYNSNHGFNYASFLFNRSPNYFQLGRTASPIEIDECIVDSSNTLTFKIILMMGVIFVSISAIISFYIDKVDRKVLLSKRSNVYLLIIQVPNNN